MVRNRTERHGGRERLTDDDSLTDHHRRHSLSGHIGAYFGRRLSRRADRGAHRTANDGADRATGFTSNLFEMEWPPRSGRLTSFPEIDRLAWFDYPTALKKIIAYQKPFLLELHAKLEMRP